MGSLNLHELKDYKSIQFYAGGKNDLAIQGFVEGDLKNTAKTVRHASILAGGMVGVTRNPVTISYLKDQEPRMQFQRQSSSAIASCMGKQSKKNWEMSFIG
ncbi:hypothetical protein LSPCS325_28680 [Lysinibacillus sp. CTST325]